MPSPPGEESAAAGADSAGDAGHGGWRRAGGPGRAVSVALALGAVLVAVGLLVLMPAPGVGDRAGADAVPRPPATRAADLAHGPAAPRVPSAVPAGRAAEASHPAGRTDRPGDAGDAGDAAVVAAAQDLLRRRAEALHAGNRQQWLASLEAGAVAYRRQQGQLFDLLRQLPLGSWTWAVPGGPGSPGDTAAPAAPRAQRAGPETWVLPVVLRYRLTGYDSADVVRTRSVTVTRRGGRLWLVGEDAGPGPAQQHDLWELGPTGVVVGRSSLVLGRAPAERLRELAAEVDAAVARVDALWTGRWSRRVVVLLPHDEPELRTVLGLPAPNGQDRRTPAAAPDLREVAALTNGHVAPGASVTGAVDRVVVNPAAFGRLSPLGRLVVLTHEVTHVATRSATPATTPLWLSEGFADYVGYRGSGVPVVVGAAGLLAEVRAGRAPAALPSPQDFAAGQHGADRAYEQAWLACLLVAERYGEDTLVRLYQAAAAQPPAARGPPANAEPAPGAAGGADHALGAVLGVTPERFVDEWRAYLLRHAG